MDRVSKTGPNVKRRRSSSAEDIAAEEFGGRYFGWRDWGGFTDIHPKPLAENRRRVLWRDDPS